MLTLILMNMGNTILAKVEGQIKKVRITDIDKISDFVKVSKDSVFKLRRASVSAGNRVKLDHMISGMKVETHDIQPKDADHDANKFWDMTMSYKKAQAERIELTKEDKDLLDQIVARYNKNSVMHELKKRAK